MIRNRIRRLKVIVKHEDLWFAGSQSKFRLLEELHKYVYIFADNESCFLTSHRRGFTAKVDNIEPNVIIITNRHVPA